MQTTLFTFEAIGTHWKIDIPQNTPISKRTILLEEIIATIEDFDKTYSRFRADSLITTMSQKKEDIISLTMPKNYSNYIKNYMRLQIMHSHTLSGKYSLMRDMMRHILSYLKSFTKPLSGMNPLNISIPLFY